ncbi:MAG: hypothetical protein LBT46_00620, partial [Planctomycetaceae bacterium]|nr:hypothetical protein [Planctomycetaceae bacterium]
MDDKSNTTRYFVNAYYVYSIDNNGILHVRNDDWFLHSEKWRRVERYERDRYHRPYENCLLNTPRTELSEKDVDIITPYLFCDFPSEGYRQKQKVMKIERAAFYFHF